jgi:TRAP-type transport system periplasmic protein
MKISAPGVLGNWLRGTGANAVDGALTTFYTDIQTGVSDGVLSLALGVLPAKLYEVAPYITGCRWASPSRARSRSTATPGTRCPRRCRTP